MRPLQMVDTKTQYHHIKAEVDAAIEEVLESSMFIGGKVVNDFATALAAYNGSKHVIPCANGTDALQIAMMALDLQPGDEVITPSFTYIATVETAALLRLKPIFVEVDPKTFCIDPTALEAAITPKTKAILPVHLYGHAAPMETIMQIAEKHGLYVIEDNAQAIGCNYTYSDGTVKKTGSIGHIGCTSFYPSKNLGAYGDGGAIFTNDDTLANKLKMIASHGQNKRYYHELVGCNSRLDAIQAAILNIKLKHLDCYNTARQQAANYYDQGLAKFQNVLSTPFRAAYNEPVFHQYTLILNNDTNPAAYRDGLSQHLADRGIPSMIYYPVPCHRQQMFA
ncbi:MAG: hypothetical protein RLY16_631, partial [Bacteroidota bacterium]